MPKVSWIHLSDWHQRGASFDRERVRDALVLDIRDRSRINEELARLDFAVFSGDLAYSGAAEEYSTADHEFVRPVLEACGLSYEQFFVVPGNHDVRRDLAKKLGVRLADFSGADSLARDFADAHKRNIYLGSLGPYSDYVGKIQPRIDPKNRAYGCGRALTTSTGVEIGFLSLNSTWLSSLSLDSAGEVEDYGQLIVGEPQIEEALGSLGACHLILGVFHHPFSWLALKDAIDDRRKVRNRLMEICDVVLHGHEHEPATFLHQGTYGKCITIPAGATFTRRDPTSQSGANGYNYGRIDLDEKTCKVHFRRFDGESRWLADLSTVKSYPAEVELEIPSLGEKPKHKHLPERKSPGDWDSASTPGRPRLVTSKAPESTGRLDGLVLEKSLGGVQVSIFVQGFGVGIRRLVNNRHILAHAVSPSTPYSNVFTLCRGPVDFKDAENAKKPAWKLWLVSNGQANSRSWMHEDDERLKEGWHHFLVRWNHEKPIMEVLLDGSAVIQSRDYLRSWPKRIMAHITVGSWPSKWAEHFVETWLANVGTLTRPFDDAAVAEEVTRCKGLATPEIDSTAR